MATEAETKEPISETDDIYDTVNAIENSVGGKQEKDSEVNIETLTEVADKHAMNISEKTRATFADAQTEEKGNEFHDETVDDEFEEEKIEAKNLEEGNVKYSISEAKQLEKGSTNEPTVINISDTPKGETIEKQEENFEEVIEGKEVETQAGNNEMQEIESISVTEPTKVEQKPDTNVPAFQQTEDDNQNDDDETGEGGHDSNINIGVFQSPLLLQEMHDHENVSRTKNEREITETVNHQDTTEENAQTEKTDTNTRELEAEALEINKGYNKEMGEDKEVLIQDQLESYVGETETAEVNNAKGPSIKTSRINLDGDVREHDYQLNSKDESESSDVHEIAKEEEERLPTKDTKESSSTIMEESAVKEDEENIDESKDISTLTKTTQVEYVQENGANSYQTNASISLNNVLGQDEQKDKQDESTSLKIGNEIQTEPKLYERDETTETSGGNIFKDTESMERDTENSIENQPQQISSDVYLDSLATELEITTEGEIPIEETDDMYEAVNAIENSVGGKQENDSEVNVETETEAADKHAMNTGEKTTADFTDTQTEEKGNKFHDETVDDKFEEEKIEAKNGILIDVNVNYSISDEKRSEKGSTNEPTEINTSNIPKGETIEKEEENLAEVIEGKEVETQAGSNKMQEVERISVAELTDREQKPDINVAACQETKDDILNDDEETGRGSYDSNINIGISQSPLLLQETHDHEDVSGTKNEKEINEADNRQGTSEENAQTEKTDTDTQELEVEALEIDKEYHKEMGEDKEVIIQDQLESYSGEKETAEVYNAKGPSIETSRINMDGDVGEHDCQLKSEDKFGSSDVYEIAKEEEKRMPTEDREESSSTTMEECALKEDEENTDESSEIPTLTKTTQVEYVQENGANLSCEDQTNSSISLSNVIGQDEQDKFTSLKVGNGIQTEPKLYETDDTTEISGANNFKDKESMETNTENSIENQLQKNSSDVYLDSLTTELEIITEVPIDETVKEDTSNANKEASSIFAAEASQDQEEGVNATNSKDEENTDKFKDIPTLTKTTQLDYDDQTDASISLINGLSTDEQKDKKDEFTSLRIGHEMQNEQKLRETDNTINTNRANNFKDEENMEINMVNSVERQLQQNSSDVYLDSLNAELEMETEGEIPITETVKEDTSIASTGAPTIFTVETSQYQGEESNAIDTKARDIGLAVLDGTLSSNKAWQEMDIHDDHEYKEENLETKLLQEETEDKSIKKETGTGAKKEFYEARVTVETKETDFKESAIAERNVEKEILDGTHFHENVTKAEETCANEMDKGIPIAKKDKGSNDEDSKDTISNISENSTLQESPALITDEMEDPDIPIADDLIQKPEKEEAYNVMAQKDIDESLIVEKETTSTSNDTSVKARTAPENKFKQTNEIIASLENNRILEEQLAIQHITEAKQESFNTDNANEIEEDKGFQDKECTEENISEKEILDNTKHEKSPHVILEDLETTTDTNDTQQIEFENQGTENEDNGSIEASVPSTEAISSDGVEDNLVFQLPKEAADSSASLKNNSESEKNRYVDASVEEEKFEDAAKEKENDKPVSAQLHVEDEVSELNENIIVKENEIAEKENCSTKTLSQSKRGHPSEEEYKNEAVAVENDSSQEQMIKKKEEKDDINEELEDYKMEPKVGMKTMEEGEEDRSTEEINITEDITTEELDVHPKLHEEQKEEHHIENEILVEKTAYKSCDEHENNENKSNNEKETADNLLTFERTNKTGNNPEVTSTTENLIKEEEDFHTRLQEEKQNESLHTENEKPEENATCKSCDASESNETESTKEKGRAKKDIVNREGPEIITEAGNIHESKIMDIDVYNEDNPQSSEDVVSETEIDPDDQNTKSIQTTDSKLSEKAREPELGPQINTETPCDTTDATYVSLDKEIQNDFEAVKDKIHSKVDVIHVSENDEEKKEAYSSLQYKVVEGESYTEQELYQESKSSETNENKDFANKKNTEKITDSEEDKSEEKEPDVSSRVSSVNSGILAETKDCNQIKLEKQEPVTIHEPSFNKEEEYVMVEEANFEIQYVDRREDTMKEEDTTPEQLSHQMAEKEATIIADQETSAERKNSNEKEIEEKDISEHKIADRNDNVSEIETERQHAQIDDEWNLQKGEDTLLIKSRTETEPGDERIDSAHPIDGEAHPEKVNNVHIASIEKNIKHAPEVIEDAVQNSCVELEDSDNNDKEMEETNSISQNKEEVIKPQENANERKLGQDYSGINNEEDTQEGEDTHAESMIFLNPVIQSSNSIIENEEGQLIPMDDDAFREEAATGKVKVEELTATYIDPEILHDDALQKLSLEAEEKASSANIQGNASSENEIKDSKTKENEAVADLKGLEVATENQTIHASEIKKQDATDNSETLDVELDAENQDYKSIHTILEAVITSEEVKDIDSVSQEDTKTVQVEEKIHCMQEENGKALINVEKEDRENRDSTVSLQKEDFDGNPKELNGSPSHREGENEQLQAEQICSESGNSSTIHDNASFPEKESVTEEDLKDRKLESFSILVPDDLNVTPKSNIEKETTEFKDEKHTRKGENPMLVESAITEETGNESNTLVSGTDEASACKEAKEEELASPNEAGMTHANALNGNEDPLHKKIENNNRVLDEKILSETSEGHENKSPIERNLIVEEAAKIAAAKQEKDQDEEHIEESEMGQSDVKVEQNESTIKMGIENTEIDTALSKDDKIETAHAELINVGKAELDIGVVPADGVKGNNDQLTEQSKMLSNDTEKETDDSFSKISNYWPINYNDKDLDVNKIGTLKLDEKTECSLQPVHNEDMLQDRSLHDPELNQSEQVKETEQMISTEASAESENDNTQEENLPFSQFLMKHILMNDSDSVKTSYDEKIVDISRHNNDKLEDDIDISKEDEVMVSPSSVEKIYHASIVDDGAGFHEKCQGNIEVQVDDKSDVKDGTEVTDNQKEMLTTESPISVLEQTQYTSILEDKAIKENPQETNKVQVADDGAFKDNSKVIDNRLGNFPMELPTSAVIKENPQETNKVQVADNGPFKYNSKVIDNRLGNLPMELPTPAVEQTQHTSIVEDKTINENAKKNTEIQVDDKCDVKNNPKSTDNTDETFTTQSPISVIEQTRYTSIPEHKAINEKPEGTDGVQLDDKGNGNDDSKVTDDKKEFSAVGLPITVDTEHKFDAYMHDKEFMQNDVHTQQNGKPKDDAVAEKLLNSYDPVQAEKSYGATSDSETKFVKSEDKEVNISNALSDKSVPVVKEEEGIHLISADREIKEDNADLLMDQQIFGKTLDDATTEKRSPHKKNCNELKAENSDITEEKKEERVLKNGLEDETTVADPQNDQQSNIVVEPENASGKNNLECNQDTLKYEKEIEKEQKKFDAPTLSEGKVNSVIKPVENAEDNQDIVNQKDDSTGEQSLSEQQKAQEVDENNTDGDEDEDREVDEHKSDDSVHDQTLHVVSRDIDVTPTKKKSHGILSGVGSKFKRSIIKVKKAITGKSSHSETHSAK